MVPEAILAKPLLIFLVEDNPDHAELIRRCLDYTRPTCRIRHVSDGEEALDYLLRREGYANPVRSPRPHLILLDLQLPKLDGLEVLRAVKASEELFRIPTVVLSSSNSERDILQAYLHHANNYLVKPIDPALFRELISAIYFYWMRWNLPPWCWHPRLSGTIQSV
jgi:CheY-like chemotaxis protein